MRYIYTIKIIRPFRLEYFEKSLLAPGNEAYWRLPETGKKKELTFSTYTYTQEQHYTMFKKEKYAASKVL